MKNILIVVALVVLIVLGGVIWYMNGPGESQVAQQPAVTEPVPEPVLDSEVEAEPPPLVVDEKMTPETPELAELPPPALHESDPYVRDNLAVAVGEVNAMQYFAAEGLAARAVATVDALGSRQVPGNIQVMMGPDDSYVAYPDPEPPTIIRNEQGDPIPQYLSDPANYERYDPYVQMIAELDVEQMNELYRRNYPLFQEAWRELGYSDGTFNDRLREIIDELLQTPVVEEPYRLIKPEAYYLFADEELEALSAGQKVLLRMGNENAALLKSKLSEFRQTLN